MYDLSDLRLLLWVSIFSILDPYFLFFWAFVVYRTGDIHTIYNSMAFYAHIFYYDDILKKSSCNLWIEGTHVE